MSSVIAKRHQDLRRMRESAQKEGKLAGFKQAVGDIFADRSVALEDFSVQGLFEACVDDGHAYIRENYNPRQGHRYVEEASTTNTGLFANIMGQYLYNAVLRAYEKPELVGDSLVTVQSTIFNGERVPGVHGIGDAVETVSEGSPYPQATFGENWIDTPETIKRGLIVDVTKEAVFFDRTGLILQTASQVGESIAINREKRILDVVLGISTVYRRNGAAAEATYQSDNTLASTALVDWVSLDAADTKFSALTDPDTGEPIVATPNTLIVPPALRMLSGRIKNATMTGQTTSSRETRVDGDSLSRMWDIISNQYVRSRSGSDTTWFYGDPKKAFAYMENWPLQVVSAPAGSVAEFERDVVARYKASERGAAGVMERRYMLKVTA